MTQRKMSLFEIYLFKDQQQKKEFGGHVRFIAAPDEKDAVHRVAFEWGHWWRTCGIREVDEIYWRETHDTLDVTKSAYKASLAAHREYTENKE